MISRAGKVIADASVAAAIQMERQSRAKPGALFEDRWQHRNRKCVVVLALAKMASADTQRTALAWCGDFQTQSWIRDGSQTREDLEAQAATSRARPIQPLTRVVAKMHFGVFDSFFIPELQNLCGILNKTMGLVTAAATVLDELQYKSLTLNMLLVKILEPYYRGMSRLEYYNITLICGAGNLDGGLLQWARANVFRLVSIKQRVGRVFKKFEESTPENAGNDNVSQEDIKVLEEIRAPSLQTLVIRGKRIITKKDSTVERCHKIVDNWWDIRASFSNAHCVSLWHVQACQRAGQL